MKTVLLFCILMGTVTECVGAATVHSHSESQGAVQDSLRHAGNAIDEAWEEFHRAALGGTLASPVLQTKIEEALNEGRRLLIKARIASEVEDPATVLKLTSRIDEISHQIKQDSKRRKQ